ncbi:hypothetical protein U9M48_026176 [Paspalum notatum var. saurae]|uniref:Uncharacterized protein n=1 Tax=Paspalum notatum var. saurae TaxID=547442 RepID=A0AAQ3TVS1_PASNO
MIHPRKYSDNGLFGSLKRSGFSVTTWALKTTPEFVWEEMEVLQVDSPLPRWVPHYPMGEHTTTRPPLHTAGVISRTG